MVLLPGLHSFEASLPWPPCRLPAAMAVRRPSSLFFLSCPDRAPFLSASSTAFLLSHANAELGNCKASEASNQPRGGGAPLLLSHKIWANETNAATSPILFRAP